MELPQDIVILGRVYDIERDPHWQKDGSVVGCVDFRGGRIYVEQNDTALELSTLFHECYHIWQQELLGEMEEETARHVSTFMHNLLMDNPDIVRAYATLHLIASGEWEDEDEEEIEEEGGTDEE